MSDSIRLTRQELYDRAWSTPMWRLGPELGMSGRGLAKLCQREGIPVPNRGYWAKKEFGWSPTKAKLLPLKPGEREPSIEFSLLRSDASLEVANAKPLPAPVPVPETLDNPHPLVAATRKASRTSKQQPDRTLALHGPGGFTADVSRAGLDRALRIVDGMVRALEARGCSFRSAAGGKETSAVTKDQEAIPFSIEEIVDRTEVPLTPRQLKDKESNPWRYRTPSYEYEPTGRLVLRLDLPWSARGSRKTWGDGSRQQLEDLLPRAVDDILKALETARLHSEELQRAAQERERQRQAQLVANHLQFQNDRRAKIVHGRLQLWRDVQSMNVWLEEVRSHAYEGMNVEFRQRWIQWIEQYLADSQVEAVRFPPFEQEPSYEEKTKYNLWGS